MVVDKHIPLIQRRVKSQIKPGWLTQEALDAMKMRDCLKKRKKKRKLIMKILRSSNILSSTKSDDPEEILSAL